MNHIKLESLDDPRIAVFRDLRRHATARGREGESFVVEGPLIVRRLIESGHPMQAVVVQTGRGLEPLSGVPAEVPVFELGKTQMRELAGFDFHRGYLASAKRPSCLDVGAFRPDPISLAAIEVTDMENLGSMLRSASAFGIRQILLDDQSVDPYSRRVLRVSMGAALRMRFLSISDAADQFQGLVRRGAAVWASTLSADSVAMDQVARPDGPLVLVVGNEATGLPEKVQLAASSRVHIPMVGVETETGVDSLNVAVAGAILMQRASQLIGEGGTRLRWPSYTKDSSSDGSCGS